MTQKKTYFVLTLLSKCLTLDLFPFLFWRGLLPPPRELRDSWRLFFVCYEQILMKFSGRWYVFIPYYNILANTTKGCPNKRIAASPLSPKRKILQTDTWADVFKPYPESSSVAERANREQQCFDISVKQQHTHTHTQSAQECEANYCCYTRLSLCSLSRGQRLTFKSSHTYSHTHR